ncbi:MAG: ribonuclease P protein component [Spirochaetes bacterium RBG_13_51_14]|nr:MAG: ribonuclease P protein component [Spirochaetes bacterium RBG_13_51_14]
MKTIQSLKGRNLFKEVYQRGRKIEDTGIRVFILKSSRSKYVKPDNSPDTSNRSKNIRIGIALTKSFGKAYIRNKAKRRIRAIYSELSNELREGFCIIIRIDSDFKNLMHQEEKRIIRSLFERAGLLNGDAHTSIQ